MADFLRLLLSLSLSGGLLVLFAALLNRLLRGRMPRAFLYYLWLPVLLRFLLPVGADWSLTNRLLHAPEAVQPPPVVDAVPVTPLKPPQDAAPVLPAEPEPGANIPSPGSAAQTGPQAVPGEGAPDPTALFLVLWALGAAACIGVRLYSNLRLEAELWRDQRPVAAWEMELFRSLTREDNPRPALRRSKAVGSPMLAGLLRPVIWIPEEPLEPVGLRYALRHELTHWRRRDLWFKWAAILTACLHWFNPAAWYLLRAIDRDCELSCDEHIVKELPLSERTAYGELLLRCAACPACRRALSAPLGSQKRIMKERLKVIMQKNLDSKRARALLAASLAALLLVSTLLGACAPSSAQVPPDSEASGSGAPGEGSAGASAGLPGQPGVSLTALEEMGWKSKQVFGGDPVAVTTAENGTRETLFLTKDGGVTWEEQLPEPVYDGSGQLQVNMADRWDDVPVRVLRDLPEKKVTLYAVSLGIDGPTAALLRHGECLNLFPVDFITMPHLEESDMAAADYDGDGEEELAVSLVWSAGTGVFVEELHLFEASDGGFVQSGTITLDDVQRQTDAAISGEFDPEAYAFRVELGGRIWSLDITADRDWLEESGAPLGPLGAREWCSFNLEKMEANILLRPGGMPMYDVAWLDIPVRYDGGKLSLDLEQGALRVPKEMGAVLTEIR